MSHNINLWFNEKQVNTLKKLYNDFHYYIFETTKSVLEDSIRPFLNQFYEVLEESINNNPDVYHGLKIEDYKEVIDSFVFNQHNPTNSWYKILFVIKNALMNTYKTNELDITKTQPELWEDLKNNHFHLSNQHKLIEYEQNLKDLEKSIKSILEKWNLLNDYGRIIKIKLEQTKPNKKFSNPNNIPVKDFLDNKISKLKVKMSQKDYLDLNEYLGKYWVYYYETQYLKLIPTIAQVFEIDDSIKNQLLYAFVNVNYFCFESLVDEFYDEINNGMFIPKLNDFWVRYFNYKNKSKTNTNPTPFDLGVLSVNGSNSHFSTTMLRQILHLSKIKPILKTKENQK